MSRLPALFLVLAMSTPITPGEQDIFKRPLPAAERPTLVVYANHDTENAVTDPLTDFAVRLNDIHPLMIVRVDTRGLPGFLHSFAFEDMRSRFVNGLKNYWNNTQRAGGVPEPHPENSLYFVEDKTGAAHTAIGLAQGFHQAVAIAYDRQGRELARGPFPQSSAHLEEAIRRAQ